MKKIFTLAIIALVGLTYSLSAQTTFTPQYRTLSNDSIEFSVSNLGPLWYNDNGGTYIYPKGSNLKPFANTSLFIGGYDAGGNLKLAVQDYQGTDYFPGPLDDAAMTDGTVMTRWNKIWKITLQEVNDFISASANPISFNIYDAQWDAIREWPGYKNSFLDPAFQNDFLSSKTAEDFAPFVDVDANGKYSPDGGDYPAIRGDEMCWWMMNDAGGPKTLSQTASLGFEIAVSAYIFKNHTIRDNQSFYEYRITNRSSFDYDSFIVASYVDPDLGFHLDDYMSSDSVLGIGFVYNSDDLDGSGSNGYGADIPMSGMYFASLEADQGIVDLAQITSVKNDASDFGRPSDAIEYYRIMNGQNRVGNSHLINCDPNTNGAQTKYSYEIKQDSTMCVCQSPAGDYRFIMGSQPFSVIPGDVITFEQVAVIRQQNMECSSLNPWQTVYDTITNALNEPPLSIDQSLSQLPHVRIHPIPAQDYLSITSNELSLHDAKIQVLTTLGQKIRLSIDNISNQEAKIDVRSLSPGMYILEILHGDNRVTRKFTKE